MNKLDWYFDFVSPFAYLQIEQFHRLPNNVEINFVPILFAGLLKHNRHLGPAEIAEKRRFTYRHVNWTAKKLHVPFKFPSGHPFNPLPVLRLAIALGNDPEVILTIFRFIWGNGLLPNQEANWQKLCSILRIDQGTRLIEQQDVKDALHANTDRAIAAGLFGVPTFLANGEIFWGLDATDFLLDYLRDPATLENHEMQRISNLPQSAPRRIDLDTADSRADSPKFSE